MYIRVHIARAAALTISLFSSVFKLCWVKVQLIEPVWPEPELRGGLAAQGLYNGHFPQRLEEIQKQSAFSCLSGATDIRYGRGTQAAAGSSAQ